jgi:hypothetical protein
VPITTQSTAVVSPTARRRKWASSHEKYVSGPLLRMVVFFVLVPLYAWAQNLSTMKKMREILGFSIAGKTICAMDLVWIGAACSKKMTQAPVKVSLWWQKKRKKKEGRLSYVRSRPWGWLRLEKIAQCGMQMATDTTVRCLFGWIGLSLD